MTILRASPRALRFEFCNDLVDFPFTSLDPPHNLPGLDPLEGEDLVQLPFKLGDESFFIIFGPGSSTRQRVFRSWLGLVRGPEGFFELIVREVVIIIFFEQGRPQLLPKAITQWSVSIHTDGKRTVIYILHVPEVALCHGPAVLAGVVSQAVKCRVPKIW